MSGHISFAFHSSSDLPQAGACAVARVYLPATVFTAFALLALAGSGFAGCARAEVSNPGGPNGGAVGGTSGQGGSGKGGTTQITIDTTPIVAPSNADAEVRALRVHLALDLGLGGGVHPNDPLFQGAPNAAVRAPDTRPLIGGRESNGEAELGEVGHHAIDSVVNVLERDRSRRRDPRATHVSLIGRTDSID